MGSFLKKEILLHPVVLTAALIVIVMAAGSGVYFAFGSRAPELAGTTLQVATTTDAAITATGIVSPSVNPDLSFQSGGRIVSVAVSVGSQVRKGAVLTALDTASLSAARDQASANVRAQEARLADLKAGPRGVDVSQKQTAVDQATQTLADKYASAQNDVASSYSSILGALHADVDGIYSAPNSTSPALIFQTTDTNLTNRVQEGRVTAGTELAAWNTSIASSNDPDAVAASLAAALTHAIALRSYADALTQALGVALTNPSTFTSAQLTTAQANLSAFRAAVQGTITTLQADQQTLSSDKLAIKSAQDALAQAQAGATDQQIEAQAAALDAARASLEAANAALQNAIIVAPYDGTVTAVAVKVGDTIAPSSVAISLSPHSSLELDAYLSEVDAARVQTGDSASVTLDAFGTARAFSATVVSIDRSPTMQQGVPAHKVVVQFAEDSDSLAPGMTGNVTINPSH